MKGGQTLSQNRFKHVRWINKIFLGNNTLVFEVWNIHPELRVDEEEQAVFDFDGTLEQHHLQITQQPLVILYTL